VTDAGHCRRDDPHDRTRGIGRRAAGNVDADALYRSKPSSQRPSFAELALPVVGQLRFVKLANVRRGRFDRGSDFVVDLSGGPLALVRDLEVADFDTVELARKLADGDVALRVDALDDLANVFPDRLDAGVALEEGRAVVRPEVRDRLNVDCHTLTFERRSKTVSFRWSTRVPDRSHHGGSIDRGTATAGRLTNRDSRLPRFRRSRGSL